MTCALYEDQQTTKSFTCLLYTSPKQPGDEWHPLFVEALQRESYIEYLLDILLYGTPEEKKALVAEQRKDVYKRQVLFFLAGVLGLGPVPN